MCYRSHFVQVLLPGIGRDVSTIAVVTLLYTSIFLATVCTIVKLLFTLTINTIFTIALIILVAPLNQSIRCQPNTYFSILLLGIIISRINKSLEINFLVSLTISCLLADKLWITYTAYWLVYVNSSKCLPHFLFVFSLPLAQWEGPFRCIWDHPFQYSLRNQNPPITITRIQLHMTWYF